jgi:hypothetical protein
MSEEQKYIPDRYYLCRASNGNPFTVTGQHLEDGLKRIVTVISTEHHATREAAEEAYIKLLRKA